ncbi:nicotinamide N-methyase [Aureimonas sp. Leaf454]|uniref:class I SAM-dependent methyltransferase n=1 Tax=Aureimonas sp. Leaf454 TaxID=1736381 RepID=UPI0006FBF299|nr:methyltransferase [Aureimonas sp. Leaf454]KQT52674.1 nicotinamide N-methyase [Aureimonas sp. Leaf454]
MTLLSPRRARAFILANTAIAAPPHVPELRLHLADEAHDLWHRTEEELQAIGLAPPFWAFAWAGGQALARYVLDHPERVAGRRVVDFASGSGLVAIAALKAGATCAEGWDIDPFAGEATAINADLNGVIVESSGKNRIGSPVETDLLLAGDVFFDREMAASLIPWFDALAGGGLTILVGDPGRAYLPRERLTHLATYDVPVTRALEDAEVKRSAVWQWRTEPG